MSNEYRIAIILGILGSFLQVSAQNIAPEAKVFASTEQREMPAANVVDGIVRTQGLGEWSSNGGKQAWGFLELPWVKLEWPTTRSIEKIILYDRPGLDTQIGSGTLSFSDGSKISVAAIANDGGPKLVSFPAKQIKWVRFDVTDAVGVGMGLSEIEVFTARDDNKPLTWVDPFINSANDRYIFFTPGARPMGMTAAAPITRTKNQYGGGYNYNSTEILGFEQIHGWCLSAVQVMPTTGKVDPTMGNEGWKSSFNHDDEIAIPGYQRVFLEDHKVWVDFTSTERTTIYRFRFTEKSEADILTNLGGYLGNTTMINADVSKVGDSGFEGSVDSSGRFWGGPENVKVFFVAQFDKPFNSFDGWNEREVLTNIDGIKGNSEMTRRDSVVSPSVTQSYWNAPTVGVSAKYEVEAGDQIQMKIAISYTSIENARKNMKAEAQHWDFEKYKEKSLSVWNDKFGKIMVKGGTYDQKIKFYTDLWHALLGRRILNDVNGDYPDYTKGERYANFTKANLRVRTLPKDKMGKAKFNMVNSDAFWLTQWNLNVLWGLAWPDIMDNFSASLAQYAENGGLLPRGPIAGGYSYIMTGNPATNLLVSTYMKGLMTKTDPKRVFTLAKRNHMPGGMMGDTPEELQFYIDNGWCPGNAGKTLEWAFQDWSLAQMAMKMGKRSDYDYFMVRSNGWKKLFRPEQNLIFPKDMNGQWTTDDPLSGKGWVEANSWQATWSVSHGIKELAEMMGGEEVLCDKLNYAFEMAEPDNFVAGYGSGYVSYANQPGCSNAHVFNHAGKPWLSQYWVRKVNTQVYGGTTVDQGYGGHDEDQGQMGGVSALMSIGLFSLTGSNSLEPRYELTAPVFDEITIILDKRYYQGKEFKITTKNNSAENMYIQSATLNGKALETYWFTHKVYQMGGELNLVLGPRPNKEWGKE